MHLYISYIVLALLDEWGGKIGKNICAELYREMKS